LANEDELNGRVALVTGASRGIGAAIARRLARAGARVIINYCRSEQKAKQLAEEICALGGQAAAMQADVSDEAQVRAMVGQIECLWGPVEILVHNAGIAEQKLFVDMTAADWRRMMAVHLDGAFYASSAVLPGMIGAQKGSIIYISSMWGQVGASCEAHYAAAKAGVIGLARSLAKEYGLSGVRVNCVAPGMIETEMNRMISPEAKQEIIDETPLAMIGTPEDVAEAVAYLASDRAKFITGQVLSPNGGYVI